MIKKSIPNLLTFANLSFGVIAILQVIRENYVSSAICIIIAALIDRYDGRIARWLNVSSEFGKELDSLADMVSFGIAPGILLFMQFQYMNVGFISVLGIICLLLYVICVSHRLAKYNTRAFSGSFIGMPVTVAGSIVSIYALFVPESRAAIIISLGLLLLLSYLMVSRFKFKKV